MRLVPALFAAITLLPAPAPRAAPVPSFTHATETGLAADATVPAQEIVLDEVWRAGDEDDDVFFGDVPQVTTDAAGNLLVVDRQRCCVEVFAPDGQHLRTLSREGEGPGEVRDPYGACVLPDGGIALPERFAGKVVVVEADGTPRETWNLFEHYYSVNTIQEGGGLLLVAGQYNEPLNDGQIQHLILALHELDGSRRCILAERLNPLSYHPLHIDEAAAYNARQRRCAIGPDGRIHAANRRDEYRIDVYAPDGTPSGMIERAFEPWPRSREDRARIRARLEDDVRNVDLPKEFTVAACEPVIDYLHVDTAGRLWVQHARSWRDQPAGVLAVLDVFDRNGRLERQVTLRAEGNLRDDQLWLLDDGRVVLLVGAVGGERAIAEGDGLERPLQVVMMQPRRPVAP